MDKTRLPASLLLLLGLGPEGCKLGPCLSVAEPVSPNGDGEEPPPGPCLSPEAPAPEPTPTPTPTPTPVGPCLEVPPEPEPGPCLRVAPPETPRDPATHACLNIEELPGDLASESETPAALREVKAKLTAQGILPPDVLAKLR